LSIAESGAEKAAKVTITPSVSLFMSADQFYFLIYFVLFISGVLKPIVVMFRSM